MDESRWPRKVLNGVPEERREEAVRDGTGETIQRKQWKEGIALRKADAEGKGEDWGRRNGGSCEIIRKYIYIL
jgi:hypothetical protein